jgi:low affinity Fe/Cu permease
MTKTFAQFANWVAVMSGHPVVFGFAILTVVAWMVAGPFFSMSDTWQLVMNTWTNVATFLMVFLIQKLPKSRQLGNSSEAQRIDPHQRCEESSRGHREAYPRGDRDDSAER